MEKRDTRSLPPRLTRLLRSSPKKIHLVVDSLPVHHAKIVKAWLEVRKDQIELHYLPSHSPDLHPDEYLNYDLKTELAKHPERHSKGKFTKTVRSTMKRLQGLPKRVAIYSEAISLAYLESPIQLYLLKKYAN